MPDASVGNVAMRRIAWMNAAVQAGIIEALSLEPSSSYVMLHGLTAKRGDTLYVNKVGCDLETGAVSTTFLLESTPTHVEAEALRVIMDWAPVLLALRLSGTNTFGTLGMASILFPRLSPALVTIVGGHATPAEAASLAAAATKFIVSDRLDNRLRESDEYAPAACVRALGNDPLAAVYRGLIEVRRREQHRLVHFADAVTEADEEMVLPGAVREVRFSNVEVANSPAMSVSPETVSALHASIAAMNLDNAMPAESYEAAQLSTVIPLSL